LDALVAQYEAIHTDVRVEIVRAPKDNIQRRAWVAEKLNDKDTSLDIYLLDATWPAELAAAGHLVPLEERTESLGISRSAFIPGMVQANEYQGHLMALPWVADAGLLYYRSDLLDEHGRDLPLTWPELQRTAIELKESGGIAKGYVWQGAAGEDLTCNTFEHIWSHGDNPLSKHGSSQFDMPQTRSALEQMLSLVESGASPSDIANYDEASSLTTFRNGEAVFMRNWAGAWDYVNSQDSPVKERVGLAALPSSCLGGQSLALSTHSLQPDQALQFMAFLSGYEQQLHMAQEANQPPALEALYLDAALLKRAPLLEAMSITLAHTKPRPTLAEYAQVSEVIYSEVNSMLARQQDAKTTALNIQHRLDAILD
jgi:trehalose/maltose transport system substrate-binding protein